MKIKDFLKIKDLDLRVLNGFFGIIITIISILSFFNLDAAPITLLVIITFGMFSSGLTNVAIGIFDKTQDAWARILEIIIGILATIVGLILFFITLLSPPSSTTLLEFIIILTFFVIAILIVLVGFLEDNTKQSATIIMGFAGFIIAIIAVLVLVAFLDFILFTYVILLIYGISRILLGFNGLY